MTRWFDLVGALLTLGLLGGWAFGVFGTPVDARQGDIYRIIYLHVPVAFAGFFAAFALGALSVVSLFRPTESALTWSKAWSEVGLIFTALTLITGSIWGAGTWGVWWTWDARLTTTLLLAILFAAFLLLHASLERGNHRTKVCAAVGILIAADVPIIYYSVNWWRTLHQPQTIIRSGGSAMEPSMLIALLVCLALTLALSVWMTMLRARNLLAHDEFELLSMARMGV